jgi:1-acyl-sn-glycerol-3-phosphate acyltransferase
MEDAQMPGHPAPGTAELAGPIVVGLVVLLVAAGVFCWRVARQPHALRLAVLEELNYWLCRVWYRFRRYGPCTVPTGGPVIIVASHTCTADPLLICAGCQYRKIAFMIAREYADLRFWRFFVRAVDCIPVRRDGRDVAGTKQAIRHLRAGHALALFIEGRIPAPGENIQLKNGAALLAIRSGAPVIPCHISGTVYREGILAGFLARHRARIRFGPPVDLSDLAGSSGRDALAAATLQIAERIRALAPTSK